MLSAAATPYVSAAGARPLLAAAAGMSSSKRHAEDCLWVVTAALPGAVHVADRRWRPVLGGVRSQRCSTRRLHRKQLWQRHRHMCCGWQLQKQPRAVGHSIPKNLASRAPAHPRQHFVTSSPAPSIIFCQFVCADRTCCVTRCLGPCCCWLQLCPHVSTCWGLCGSSALLGGGLPECRQAAGTRASGGGRGGASTGAAPPTLLGGG
jgi:hypothetical protein